MGLLSVTTFVTLFSIVLSKKRKDHFFKRNKALATNTLTVIGTTAYFGNVQVFSKVVENIPNIIQSYEKESLKDSMQSFKKRSIPRDLIPLVCRATFNSNNLNSSSVSLYRSHIIFGPFFFPNLLQFIKACGHLLIQFSLQHFN